MSVVARARWKNAYDTQMAVWRWLRTDVGRVVVSGHARAARAVREDQTADGFVTREEQKVLVADPYFVSGEMCQVVAAASEMESFRMEALYPTDLLTSHGFCVFERPFPVPDRFDDPTSIAAFAWMPMFNVQSSDPQGEEMREIVEATEDPDRSKVLALLAKRQGREINDGIALTLYADVFDWNDAVLGARPPVIPFHFTPWWWGMDPYSPVSDTDPRILGEGSEWWWKIVQTTLRLMQQRIAVRHRELPDRPQRREARRIGFDEREVLVVRLRRERGERHEPSGEEANYSHRFIVHGFWRNQWFPSLQDHRLIYIDDYVKGPQDRPLIIKPRRAFTWDR